MIGQTISTNQNGPEARHVGCDWFHPQEDKIFQRKGYIKRYSCSAGPL
jgi:hypothetical protein